jgi:two-component system phosphate regulon sensor histidine kinase PhoR
LIQVYLLAANLFAFTALLVGLNNFTKGTQSWRLLPLFLLTASRALMVITTLMPVNSGGSTALIAALDVFSALCVVWSLVSIGTTVSLRWRQLMWLAGGLALVLALLPLIPGWPIPPQIHSLTIAVFSMPFIVMGLGRVDLLHLAAPLVLAAAYFLSLLENTFAAGLVLLLAYSLLIAALHREGVQIFQGRRDLSEAAAQVAISLSQERQRLLEVSEIISAVPSVEESMTHLVRTMANVTQADQAAVFVLDTDDSNRFRLAAIYSPERPVELTGRYIKSFYLKDFVALHQALIDQDQILFDPSRHHAELSVLYALWFEDRTGPTLLQPVSVQGYSVGALLLGNPVTHRPIHPNDQTLCRSQAAQIGSMVESYRRYIALESRINEALDEAEQRLQHTEVIDGVNGVAQAIAGSSISAAPVGQFAILEAVHEGVVVADALGRVRLVNRSAEQILGKSRQKLLGQPLTEVYGEIDSREEIENLAAAFSRRNEPLPTFLQTGQRAIQGQLIPWRNDAQEWLGIIAVFSDVTPQLNADQSRHDFIAALSRELRAPLTTIKGYSELIMRGDMDNYTPAQVYVQQIMHSSADRMVSVLDNAIQIGTQTRKKVLPQFEEVEIRQTIELAIDEIRSLAELRELTLVSQIKEPLPCIVADRSQLFRIVMNLLENACHFTPPGGQITVRVWVQGQDYSGEPMSKPELIISIADNGVGIPKTEQRRIFEPFYQIPGVLHSGGMGMGLTVVRELVNLHKGRVWVESIEHEGSIFQVLLPLRPT